MLPESAQEAPHLKHNRELSTRYLEDNAIYARWPRVSKQVELVPLDLKALPRYAYNPTIIDHNGMVLMAYRFHEGTLATKLGMAHISESGKVLSNRVLSLSGPSNEDPKFFKFDGKVHMAWVDSTWPEQPPKAVVRFGVFKDGTLCDIRTPNIGRNDGSTIEKNWVLFEHDKQLVCIHREHPRHYYKLVDMRWERMPDTGYVRWPYGEVRGGTVPIPWEGKLLRFFHSALDNEMGSQPRRYFIGAYTMEPDTFKLISVSKRPVIYGSELDDIPVGDRKDIIHHKINVAFPGGAVQRDGYWLLALGINDATCALAKIYEKNLNL